MTNQTFLVTGGAGFIGSHLVDQLIKLGNHVIVVDNFITGKQPNLDNARQTGKLTLIEADASQPPSLYLPADTHLDGIFHLASPASPKGYGEHPIETYLVNSMGTHYLIEYAKKHRTPLLYTSTSEIYGDPLEHPQLETYFGNVNPIGPRACYDESKRFGEMVLTTWARKYNLDVRIVRIFNTYGPRMDINDGRIMPNFLRQALSNQPLTIYGTGQQTRSYCYVSDLVEYIIRAFELPAAKNEIINIGNPEEYTVLELAKQVCEATGCQTDFVYEPLPQDDPTKRRPDISKAIRLLNYKPKVSLKQGLQETINWFAQSLTNN